MANNPRVFLDIAVSSIAVGQIVIEHFAYTNPLTVENFRALCTGEKGIGESDIPLHYKGSVEDSIGFLQASMYLKSQSNRKQSISVWNRIK